MNLLEILTGAGTGGLLGGVLALGNTWLTAKIRRDDRAHELALITAQRDSAVSSAQWAAFAESQRAGASDGIGESFRWVQAVRTLTRPFLTVGLGVAWYLTRDPDLLMLWGYSVGWWFGTRPVLSSRK